MFNPFPHLGSFISPSDGSNWRYNCPFCIKRKGTPDTKHHLYVDPTKFRHGIIGWFICFKCEACGPASRLDQKGTTQSRHSVTQWEQFVKRLRTGGLFELTVASEVELPEDFTPIIHHTDAYNYLIGRGITDEQIARYRIGMGTANLKDIDASNRKHFIGYGRICFPDYDSEGNLTYWVARTYYNHKLRYKNPSGSDVADKIYNLAEASKHEDVIITEGVFSAIKSGYGAIATYGKNVTDQQLRILISFGWRRYYVALDGDAKKEAIKLSEKLTSRGCDVYVVQFKDFEDPDSVVSMKQRVENALQFTLRNRIAMMLSQ